jgi:hypothetical protein
MLARPARGRGGRASVPPYKNVNAGQPYGWSALRCLALHKSLHPILARPASLFRKPQLKADPTEGESKMFEVVFMVVAFVVVAVPLLAMASSKS